MGHLGEQRRVDAETFLLYTLTSIQDVQDVQDAQPARSRAQTGDWPASSASPRLVRTAPQLFKLAPGRGLKDCLKRLDERFSSSLGLGPRLPQENLLRHLVDGLFCSHEISSPSASLLVGGRRNIVVTPGRAFKISSLIMLVLFCPLSGIIEPRVGELVRQTAFALSDLVDEGAEVGAAPTTGGRAAAGSAKGHLLAALALEGDCGRMPLVDLAKGHFAALVVCLDALEDLHHGLLPLPPAVVRQGVPTRRHS